MHPWKRFWKVDVDAAYYWDEPLKLVEASEAEAALDDVKTFARATMCGLCGAMTCKGCPISADGGR